MLLTIKEVAHMLNTHTGTVYRLCRERRLPFFRVGDRYRFDTDELQRWMSSAEKTAKVRTKAERF